MAPEAGDANVIGGICSVYRRFALSQPDAPAVRDVNGTWSYGELWEAGSRVAALLAAHGLADTGGPGGSNAGSRPLAVSLAQGREWYAVCVGAWMLGLPVVALSSDLPKGAAAEAERAARVARELRPLALVSPVSGADLPGLPKDDCVVISLAQVVEGLAAQVARELASAVAVAAATVTPQSVLCYVYTGGTTRHSKCVAVTHAMALWEVSHYASALRGSAGRGDVMLQYSSAFWGAAIFGQMDLALAFGACNVMVRASEPEDIAALCQEYAVTVLGVVPSQLRGAWPGGPATKPRSLRVILAWAERMPPRLASEWAGQTKVFEVLIASEYWLCLSSDCRTWRDPSDASERHVLRPLPGLDFKLLREDGFEADEEEAGELFLAGPTVFQGYVEADGRIGSGPESEAAFCDMDGRRYLKTKDRLKRVPAAAGGGLVYLGRADSLAKRGGAWLDLEAAEAAAAALPGVASAAVVEGEGREAEAFLVLENPRSASGLPRCGEPLGQLVEEAIRQLGGAIGGGGATTAGATSRPRIWASLPLHPATAKVDRRSLLEGGRARVAREVAWQSRLLAAQRTMLCCYASWHIFVLALLVIAGCIRRIFGVPVLVDILARLLLLPYLWAAMLYSVKSPEAVAVIKRWPLGHPDLLLILALVSPHCLLGPLGLLSTGMLLWLRDSNTSAALLFVSLAVLVGPLAAVALPGEVAVVALPPGIAWFPLVAGLLVFLAPGRLHFFLGLPITFLLSFPKWILSDWLWRADFGSFWLRRLPMQLLPSLRPPPFDAAICFKEEEAEVDWGDEDWSEQSRWTNLRLSSSKNGLCETVDFWEPVRPAVVPPALPRSSSGPGGDASAQGLLCSPAASPLAASLAALVERVGGRPPGLSSLDSLQAIRLAELARRELGLQASAGEVLRSGNVETLACALLRRGSDGSSSEGNESQEGQPDQEGAYRVYVMPFPKSPVDWYVRFGGPGHLDLAALQRATDRLVARHSALRTAGLDKMPAHPDTRLRIVHANGIQMRIAEHGQSPGSLGGRSFRHWLKLASEHLAQDMLGLLSTLGKPCYALVGHDWGAILVWYFGLMHPQAFPRLCAMSVPPATVSGPAPPVSKGLAPKFGDDFYYIVFHNEFEGRYGEAWPFPEGPEQQTGVPEQEYDAAPEVFLRRIYLSGSLGTSAVRGKIKFEAPSITDPKRAAGQLLLRLPVPKADSVMPHWLEEPDFQHYVREFQKSGFRGGVNYYRCLDRNWHLTRKAHAACGGRVRQPTLFIVGEMDPALKASGGKEKTARQIAAFCADLRGCAFLPDCGHWNTQEKPAETNLLLIQFLDSTAELKSSL
ncbi:unnamed protein product [Polarella glacialis]|uniref:Uncharacterized protein n=1 Tax=Polarella glacialis TaxID=89957 RepID=A0A813GA58_POLGL|nr:unnamed protein product [Polarella glacialis]